MRSIRIRFPRTTLAAALTLALWVAGIPLAVGAELRVLCPSALRVPVLELARTFARSSGHRVEIVFASVGAIHKRVATGESPDVAIGTAQGVDALVRLGRGAEESQTRIVRSVLALAVRRGSVAPDVATAEALAEVLRAAASIVQPDPGVGAPGGAQVAELLERLGLGAELKPKTRFVSDSREVVKRIAAGSSDIGIAAMSDIAVAGEVVTVGPITDPATTGVVYAGVVVRGAKSAHAGRAFIAHLVGAGAATVFRAAGYATPD